MLKDIKGYLLYCQVRKAMKQGKAVAPVDACRFINHIFYGGFNRYKNVDVRLKKNDLAALSLNEKLTLYESIASEDHPVNKEYLCALSDALNLPHYVYERNQQMIKTFLTADKFFLLNEKWPNFISLYQKALHNFAVIQLPTKQKLLQFMADAYCDHAKIERVKVKLVAGKPDNYGCYYLDDRTVELNHQHPAFINDFAETVDTLLHEISHGSDADLGKQYVAGKIKPRHSHYIAARAFAANLLSVNGFIFPEHNLKSYERQPAEISVRKAGAIAKQIIQKGIMCVPRQSKILPGNYFQSAFQPRIPRSATSYQNTQAAKGQSKLDNYYICAV